MKSGYMVPAPGVGIEYSYSHLLRFIGPTAAASDLHLNCLGSANPGDK